MEWRHLPDVICQCSMAPAALPVSSTFLVRSLLKGRNRRIVAGRLPAVGLSSVWESVPVCALKTRTAPSPQPAAKYLPSGENLTEKTSAARPAMDIQGTSFLRLGGAAGAYGSSSPPKKAMMRRARPTRRRGKAPQRGTRAALGSDLGCLLKIHPWWGWPNRVGCRFVGDGALRSTRNCRRGHFQETLSASRQRRRCFARRASRSPVEGLIPGLPRRLAVSLLVDHEERLAVSPARCASRRSGHTSARSASGPCARGR
mmetsp:Transcript_388/g.1369  ORF Transcript_388/g.1369 Transcript_388/m.1369 type:complete len:258 (-) Transcript_388:485-1258(-)